MRIGINIAPLRSGQSLTGIGYYLYQVLVRIIEADHDSEYYLFINGQVMEGLELPDRPSVHIVRMNSKSSLVLSRYLLVNAIKKYGIDLFWSPTHSLPIFRSPKVRYCMTVYDLANYKFKNIAVYGNARRRLFHHVVRTSCRGADRIIAISEATKRDVAEMFKIPSERISVVYLGGLGNETPAIDPDACRTHGISKPYFLYVGTLQTRKNILTIVKAFVELRQSIQDIQLVLAGNMGWGMEETKAIIAGSGCKEDIILTGYIAEAEKNALYKNACCFVFPSLYEGFGIPILEAFAFGIPVITARNSALPEVGGPAAIYIEDAMSACELADRMREVLRMSEEERAAIARADAEQLACFSWDRCARETDDVLKSLL